MATILIVEDDIDTNEAICEYLQEAGYTTIPALDGGEAVLHGDFEETHCRSVTPEQSTSTGRCVDAWRPDRQFLRLLRS